MIYKFRTVDNKLLGTYDSMVRGAWDNEKDYTCVWMQVKGRKGEEWFRTPYYFSDDPNGTRHSIIVAVNSETGEEIGRYINYKEAVDATGVHRSTIDRHLHGKQNKRNFCGIRFHKEEL